MYINNQSDEIRRLLKRNDFLASRHRDMEVFMEAAWEDLKFERKRSFQARIAVVFLGTLSAVLALGLGWVVICGTRF